MQTLSLSIDLKEFHHELRTPLTGILGMATFLNSGNLTSDQKEQIEDILQCANRLLTFINETITKAPVKEVETYSPALFKNTESSLLLAFP